MNIALSGKLACGKSVLANHLVESFGYTIVSIGAPIKKATNFLIENKDDFSRYVIESLETLKGKEIVEQSIETIFHHFDSLSDVSSFIKQEDGSYIKNDDYRKLTQYIATEFRTQYGEDVWAIFAVNDALKLTQEGHKVICDDLRLPSEKKIFEKAGFKIIRLNVSKEVQKERIASRGDGTISEAQLTHPTEIALDNESFDLTLDTDTLSIEEVKNNVIGYLEKVSI